MQNGRLWKVTEVHIHCVVKIYLFVDACTSSYSHLQISISSHAKHNRFFCVHTLLKIQRCIEILVTDKNFRHIVCTYLRNQSHDNFTVKILEYLYYFLIRLNFCWIIMQYEGARMHPLYIRKYTIYIYNKRIVA